MDMLRELPALRQIQLAFDHKGYTVDGPDNCLLVSPPGLPQMQIRIRYLDPGLCSQNQLLELLIPLGVRPEPGQMRELAPVMAACSGSRGMALVFGPEGLSLRKCLLHPRQMPDLRALLQIPTAIYGLWHLTRSLLALYLAGRLPLARLQEAL